MTRAEFDRLKINQKVKIVQDTCSHCYTIGGVYKLLRRAGSGWILQGLDGTPHTSYVTSDDIQLVYRSRNEELLELKEKIAQSKKDIEETERRIVWLSSYKNNLDEAVRRVAKLLKIDNPDDIKKMYKTLVNAGINPDFEKSEKAKDLSEAPRIAGPRIDIDGEALGPLVESSF